MKFTVVAFCTHNEDLIVEHVEAVDADHVLAPFGKLHNDDEDVGCIKNYVTFQGHIYAAD